MRYVCLLALIAPMVSAQDGAAIYKEHCASCHDSPAPRVPSLSALKAMSGKAIYLALTDGPMKAQASGMSTTQLFALIGYIGPSGDSPPSAPTAAPACKSESLFQARPNAPQWNGWSVGLTNARFQEAASAGLTASNVAKLKLKWAFNLGDVTEARSQPSVVGGRIFIGSMTGAMYALDADTGCMRWSFRATAGIRGGATVGAANGTAALFFADTLGNMYALNARTGGSIWKVRPVDHYTTLATATPLFYKGVVYQSFSSFEEALAGDPKFQCCTFRGSVAALNANTGEKLWQTFTIPEIAKPTRQSAAGTPQFGPSGAGIWSTPTIDEKLGVLYVATGDNYSDPPTNASDAVLALDLKTGNLVWSAQLTQNDAYNNGCSLPFPGNCPETHGADSDFGQSPILVGLDGTQRVLAIAQKSGMVYALDPDKKGQIVWRTRVGEGGALGGSQWGSASDGNKVYVAISDVALSGVPDAQSPKGYRLVLDPAKGGGLHALDLRTGKIVWDAKPSSCPASRTDCSPAQSAAVSAIPGVVFSGSVDGHLRAYSSETGQVLWDVNTARDFQTINGKVAHGGSMDAAGPSIVNGMVLVNSGYGQWGGMPGNVLLVFSAQ